MRNRTPALIMATTALAACLTYAAFVLSGARPTVTIPEGSHEGQPILGQADAPKVYLFESYSCGHCRTFEEKVMPQLERDYINPGRVQIVTINLPNSNEATTAALAGLCAHQQNERTYWTYRTLIYGTQSSHSGWATTEVLTDLARTLWNLDADELKACIDELKFQGDIQRNLELAEAAGVTRTPTVVIGDQGFVGTRFEPIREALERHLAD